MKRIIVCGLIGIAAVIAIYMIRDRDAQLELCSRSISNITKRFEASAQYAAELSDKLDAQRERTDQRVSQLLALIDVMFDPNEPVSTKVLCERGANLAKKIRQLSAD